MRKRSPPQNDPYPGPKWSSGANYRPERRVHAQSTHTHARALSPSPASPVPPPPLVQDSELRVHTNTRPLNLIKCVEDRTHIRYLVVFEAWRERERDTWLNPLTEFSACPRTPYGSRGEIRYSVWRKQTGSLPSHEGPPGDPGLSDSVLDSLLAHVSKCIMDISRQHRPSTRGRQ